MADDDDQEGEEHGGGGLDPELVKSYVRFLKRAVRAHRLLMSLVLVGGLLLTVAAYRYIPRTYRCTTVLMVDSSQVLEGNNGVSPASLLSAAESLILRHDNLEQIVRETGLIKKFKDRRPPVLALKDRIVTALLGEMNDEIMLASLVGSLENRITVKVDNGTLGVTAEWTDGVTAAELADAARESFVKTRHVAEMSAFEEKLSILDGHAAGLRDEIESEAKQARALLDEHVNDARMAARAAASNAARAEAPPTLVPRARPATTDDSEDRPDLKAELDEKRKKLVGIDTDRDQRIADEKQKVDDLKLKYTPSHPLVITAEQRLAILQQEPSDVALLRAEVQSLESELRQHDVLRRGPLVGGSRSVLGTTAATQLDPLPGEIGQLLDAANLDPALAAQLSSAVSKYGALRDDIRTGHIQFDTAQAAFNFRYRIVVPAEVPRSPAKPKAAAVLGGGMLLSLLLAFVLPVLLELRKGVIVERWQVAMVQLPVLAELRLPPAGGERQGGPMSNRNG